MGFCARYAILMTFPAGGAPGFGEFRVCL